MQVTQNILLFKIVDQIWPRIFSYELNKLFLDILRSGYLPTNGLELSIYFIFRITVDYIRDKSSLYKRGWSADLTSNVVSIFTLGV